MVLEAFASIGGIINARLNTANVDNFVFRLHYRVTTAYCFIACALVVTSEFIGSSIHCTGSSFVTTYCWVASSYTINTTNPTDIEPFRHSFHGIGTTGTHEKRFHSYYQWVPLVLFLQGCLFYFPHLLWKSSEGKLMESLLQELHFTLFDDNWSEKTKNIVKYLRQTMGYNNDYFYKFVQCEILNFINVLAQMFLMDMFFSGMFLHMGSKVLALSSLDDKIRHDSLIETFPRVTKCDYMKFGFSGSEEKFGVLCFLPQNLLNEKIYILMWVWFVCLISITGALLIVRLLLVCLPMLRVRLIERRGKLESTSELNSLVRKMDHGDFFLLSTLSKNLNTLYFKDILCQLTDDNPYEKRAKLSTKPQSTILPTYKPYNEGIDEGLMEMKERRNRYKDLSD